MVRPQFQDSKHFKDYWEKGNGKQLLDWTDWKPSFQNFEKLAHLYYQVDELGDAAVKDTYLKLPYNEASAIVQNYSKNKISESEEAPESLKKMFLQMQNIPEWYDEKLANIGARFCMRVGTNALIILRDFTLMGGYDYAYLNKPLIHTGVLKKSAVKRLKDTLEFWTHVTRENALKTNSEAYQLTARTRLMHSYARISIKKKIENWDYENWGEPINSWDMIATYTGFSLITIQGLKKLGIKISGEEELGVFHLWKYIGYLLGIPAEFLPENKQQAVEQLYLWSATQDQGDKDSVQLAKALLDENLTNTIYKFQFQRKLLLNMHKGMNHFLLDKEINHRLQIPEGTLLSNIFPKIIIKLNQLSMKLHPLDNVNNYEKHVQFGNKNQMKVLDDYIKHSPKDFHY